MRAYRKSYVPDKDRLNLLRRLRRAANPELFRARAKATRAKKPELYRALYKDWACNNREKCRESVRKWKARNPEYCRIYSLSWNRENQERLFSHQLKLLKPDQSMFPTFAQLNENYEMIFATDQKTPLDHLIEKEENNENTAS